MPNNDFTAQAGISLEQWKKDIAQMTGDMAKVSQATEKTSKSLSMLETAGKWVAGFFGARALVQWGKDMMGANVQTVDAARNLDVTAEGLQRLNQATHGELSDGEFEASMKSLRSAMDEARSGSHEAADALDQLGVSVETVQSGKPDEAFLQIADGAKHASLSVAQLNKVFGENARAVNEVFKAGGSKLREGMAGATVTSGLKAGVDKQIARQIETTKKSFLAQAWAGLTGGPAMEGAAKDLEKLAELKKKAEAPAKANEQKQATIDIAKAQRNYLIDAQQADISIESQAKMIQSEVGLMEQQLELLEKQGRGQSIAAEMVRKEIHDRWQVRRELEHQLDIRQETARNTTQEMEAELNGNKLVSDLLKNRLEYEIKIKQANHELRFDLAAQLRTQQALSELAIRAAAIRQTPQQRRDAAKEQQAQGQAERIVNAQDKIQGDAEARDEAANRRADRFGFRRAENPSFRRAGQFVSPATARARAEFAARHAAPQAKEQFPGLANLRSINAQTISATSIKPGT